MKLNKKIYRKKLTKTVLIVLVLEEVKKLKKKISNSFFQARSGYTRTLKN